MRAVGRKPPWQSLPIWARDGLGAAAFAAVSLLPALRPEGLNLGELPERHSDALHVLLILAQTLPLALRRLRPATVLAAIGLAFALDQSLAYPPSPGGLGILVALYSAGAHQQRRRPLTIALGAVAYVVLATVLSFLGSPELPWELATFVLVLAAAWGPGELMHQRADAARLRAEEAARAAVAAERARLASELHDVVSHHVTGMVVQADAAAFLLPAGETSVREQLASIAGLGRRALVDLRQLLDVLGAQDAPVRPAIGTLDGLVADARAAGQLVGFEETGTEHAADEVRLAIYRIAQEGLTNARKHAPGARTQVSVDWAPPEAHIELATAPAAAAVRSAIPGSGRGLAGLAERVRHLGGRFGAGADARGWFVLTADIPTGLADDTHDQ